MVSETVVNFEISETLTSHVQPHDYCYQAAVYRSFENLINTSEYRKERPECYCYQANITTVCTVVSVKVKVTKKHLRGT